MKHKPNDDEVDCYHNRAGTNIDNTEIKRTRVSGGRSYPKLSSPLTSVPIDHGFNPDRDRIDADAICSNAFGVALGGQSTPRQPNSEGAVNPNPAPSAFSRRRF
jgi:hypothetical protein